MRALIISIALILSTFGPSLAQDSQAYKGIIEEMNQKAERLIKMGEIENLNFTEYDQWYQDFKVPANRFSEEFSLSFKQHDSYIVTRDAVISFEQVWSLFSQAKKSTDLFNEFASDGDMSYANKWRTKSAEQVKQAREELKKAIKLIKDAQDEVRGEYP